MHCDDHDIVAFWPMNNPQHPASIFRNRFIRPLTLRMTWIGLNEIGRVHRRVNPPERNGTDGDRFLSMFRQTDHATPLTLDLVTPRYPIAPPAGRRPDRNSSRSSGFR